MIISGRKLLTPPTPSTSTKSRNPPDDSPSHPEAQRLHPVGALARPHWKEVAPCAIDFCLHRQGRTLPMTRRVTRRLGGYCRGNYPPVGSRRRKKFSEQR